MSTLPLSIQNQVPADFHPDSRIWIYQSDRLLDTAEKEAIEIAGKNFAREWTAHKVALKSGFFILAGGFLVLVVDESLTGASGCSIDTSVRFIRGLEGQYDLKLMERLNVAYLEDEKVKVISLETWKQEAAAGNVTLDTPVFNNMITRLSEIYTGWIQPAGESWLKKFFQPENQRL